MFYIEDDKVYLTKGDSAALTMTVYSGNTAYTLQSGDLLTMSVRKQPTDQSPLLLSVTSTSGRLVISHEDSKSIPAGKYSADVQLTTSGGERYTIWPELPVGKRHKAKNYGNFIIMPEVTTT